MGRGVNIYYDNFVSVNSIALPRHQNPMFFIRRLKRNEIHKFSEGKVLLITFNILINSLIKITQ